MTETKAIKELKSQLEATRFRRDRDLKKIEKLHNLSLALTIESADYELFMTRSGTINELFEDFNRHQADIIRLKSRLGETAHNEEADLSDDVSDKYYHILSVISKNCPPPSPKVKDQQPHLHSQAKLPKISLPTFSGSFKEWPTFYDLFRQLVHENKSLSSIEKFMYLIGSCTNDALRLAKNLPITDINYVITWQSFVSRFQNKRKLATCYLDEIQNISPVTSKTSRHLRSFIDTLSENTSALKTLDLPVEQWSFLLLHSVICKVDQQLRTAFELKHSSTELPTFEQFLKFLDEQCRALEITQPTSELFVKPYKPSHHVTKPSYSNQLHSKKAFVSNFEGVKCLFCNEAHTIYKCKSFGLQTPAQRKDWIKSRKACFNCLRSYHMLNECPSKTNCLNCGARHNTLLHNDFVTEKTQTSKVRLGRENKVGLGPSEDSNESVEKLKLSSLHSCSSTFMPKTTLVLLGTALIHVRDRAGQYQPVRALIDCGSQTSFMTEACCQRLRLPRNKFVERVCGVAETSVPSTKGIVSCFIKSRFVSEPCFQSNAIVLPKITPFMPSTSLPENIRDCYKDLELADPYFDTPGKIDFLLGADLYSEVLNGGRLPAPNGFPIPHNSICGWVLMGPVHLVDNAQPSVQVSSIVSNFVTIDNSLDDQLRTFWELEDVPAHALQNPDDEKCENIFCKTVSRNHEGRYTVSLPFKDNEPSIGDSYSYAANCFKNLEHKLSKRELLKHEYSKFIHEYLDLGHMSPVPYNKIDTIKCYLPHHPVIKETSSTTKLRVVFNASAKTSNGKSLNDNLLIGPKLQKNIVEIILNFRMHIVAFTADICKMYRQILLDERHQAYQAILWRDTPTKPLETYMLKTVTYGVSSAPFLAIRTLQKLASDEGHKYPLAANVLMNDIYVDDIVSGSHSVEAAVGVRDELIEILKTGGFELRKWSSNEPNFLSDIPVEHQEVPLRFDGDNKETIKVLGIQWESKQDVFTFHVGVQFLNSTSFTKRGVLSCLSRIFDPLGYVGPVVFWAKHFMQQLWTLSLGWDEPLPSKLEKSWEEFVHQLPDLEKLSLPRHVIHSSTSCELHGFCDAAESGYCGVVYLRTKTESDVHSQLIMAKTKVSPLKRISIPKLELCGAYLLSKMISLLCKLLRTHFEQVEIFTWCDSLTVISWIKMSPHLLKTFVANRVTEIQQSIAPSAWRYVSSADNPADCGSRGIFPGQILNHHLWWHGPSWLLKDENEWPKQPKMHSELLDLSELKPSVVPISLNTTKKNSLEFIERFSSLIRLQRIGAWCLRFIANCRKSQSERTRGNLTLPELNASLRRFVKQTQEHYFKEEIKLIRLDQPCTVKLRRLDPFLDDEDILRVGGRIRHSSLSFLRKHPALLPKYSHLTFLVIDHYHQMHLHAGPQVTQAVIQRQFWILSALQVIRQQIHKCFKCFRFRQSLPKPFMADLPAVRLQCTRVFLNCAVDFAGPYNTKSDKLRKPQLLKSYLCLFICLATRAVHLEVASGLSTDNFLAALHRFIARRGMCATIISDRGTNFIGANNVLHEYQRFLSTEPNSSNVTNLLANEGIKWQFNPPSSPHFGGIWEANIRSAKSLLKKVIGEQVLTQPLRN